MANYCINGNTQGNGDFEVHDLSPEKCKRLPKTSNRINLGQHTNIQDAVMVAKKRYPHQSQKISGCHCC